MQVVVELSIAWWFKHWLCAVLFFAWLTGTTPDPQKVNAMLERAIRTKVKEQK